MKTIEIRSAKRIRADRLIKARFPHLSNREITSLFSNGMVSFSQGKTRKGRMLERDEPLYLALKSSQFDGAIYPNSNSALDVVYEDDALIAMNKQANIHTLPLNFADTATLMNALAAHLPHTVREGGVLNAGSVNRLDYETSGLVLAAKSERAYPALKDAYADDSTEKYYIARVEGRTPSYVDMTDKIKTLRTERMSVRTIGHDGEHAYAQLFLLRSEGDTSLVLVRLVTGVRHQIRIQLASRGWPIIGDSKYGGPPADRLYLHALSLIVRHPLRQQPLSLLAPLPESFIAEPASA